MFARLHLPVLGIVALVLLAVTPRTASAQVVPDCQTGCTGGYSVDVTPDNAPDYRNPNSTPDTVLFTVQNTGATNDTYTMACLSFGGVTCVSVSPTSKTLGPDASTTVKVVFSVAVTDGQVYLTATGHASDQGYFNVTVRGKPLVDITPYNFNKQDFGRCAQACFAAVYSQSTVPYFSLDAPRSVTLAYNGQRVNAKAFVLANVSPDVSYGVTPTKYQLQVKVNGALVTFVNGEQTLNFAYTGTAAVRLAGEFNDSTYATGVYPLLVIVSAVYPSSVVATSVNTSLTVVNETTNPIARGWTLAGVQRVYVQGDGSALVTEGDGSAVYFLKGGGFWASPPGEFSSFTSGTPYGAGWTRSFPDSTKVLFDATGKMIEVRDRFVNKTTITYDASGRIWKVTDPQNLVITLGYGTNGLSTITDAGSPARVTTVTVDASKRLTAIRDPDNISTTFDYDTANRLATITNRSGKSTTFGYDANAGTLASVTGPNVAFYDGTAAPVDSAFAWQKVGVPYTATAVTPFTPLPIDSAYARLKEPGGAVTRFTVNHWGTPMRVTDALAHVISATFDGNGLPIKTIYPNGAVDSAVYNSSGLPTFVQRADATNRRTIRYAGWAQPDSASGGPQPGMRAFIGVNGRVDSTRVGDSAVTRYVYDGLGRVVSSTDPTGHLVVKHWFAGTNGNTDKDSVPGGGVTTYLYDSYGRDTSVDGPASPMRRMHYDSLNRQTIYRDGVYTPPTVTAYDSVGNVVSVTDEKGQVYKFAYNALGWLIARTDPANKSDTLKYNRDGDLMRFVNRRNQTVSFAYDALHRDTSKTGANTDTLRWTYSANGRVITSIDPVTTETAYLNVRGQPDSVKTAVAARTFTRIYRYTTRGLLDSVAVSASSGSLAFTARKYGYDTRTLALSSIGLNGRVTNLGRNADLQPDTITYPGGDRVQLQYSGRNALANITSGAAYSSTVTKLLDYDTEGRLHSRVNYDLVSGTQFTYDGLGRLRSDSFVSAPAPPPGCTPPQIIGDNGVNCLEGYAWQVGNPSEVFSFDSVGNRTDHSAGPYNVGNRITSFAGCGYTTDADGNVTARSGTCGALNATFKWTAESRLDTVIVGVQTIGYHYDAAGRLVRKDSAGVVRRYFLWEGGNLLAELKGANADTLIAEYSYYPGLDNLHALLVGGTEYEAHSDPLGNVSELTWTDVGGLAHTMRTYQYTLWGDTISGGVDSVPFNHADRTRWKGALWLGDEANLYYMRNRWYEPATGRFLSEDPIGLDGGINQYTYASDDAVNASDPSGTCAWEIDITPDGTWVAWCRDGGTGPRVPGGDRGAGYDRMRGGDMLIPVGWTTLGHSQWNSGFANVADATMQPTFRVRFEGGFRDEDGNCTTPVTSEGPATMEFEFRDQDGEFIGTAYLAVTVAFGLARVNQHGNLALYQGGMTIWRRVWPIAKLERIYDDAVHGVVHCKEDWGTFFPGR